MPAQSSIALIGPGAIGTTVAAALHEAGHTPTLCGRSPHASLQLRVDDGGVIDVPGPVRTDPAGIERPFDLVFLAVKATQIAAAAPWLAACCGPRTVLCVLQNGVEQKEMVAPYLRGGPVLPAVVWFPAQREADGAVWLRGQARLTVPDAEGSNLVASALRGSRCTVDVAADFASIAWHKLLRNAVSGLMALTGRRAGMFGRPDITALALAYLREGLAVARAEGATLSNTVPQDIVDFFQRAPTDLGTSILTDRTAGAPLEWAIRNGVVQRRGRAHGIATPISDVIVPLLAAASDGPG